MFSIIIPVFNQYEMTCECIKAIYNNTPQYEIIIIDNGSDPVFLSPYPLKKEGITQFRDSGGMMFVIRNETNLGFSVAINQGIRVAAGNTIILLNNDVIVTPQWADKLRAHLDTYGIIAPVTNYCAGFQQVALEVYDGIDDLYCAALKWGAAHAGETQEVKWVIGFCMAFKKSLYDELGPFDESLWPCCGEELDFCLRARAGGYKVGIARDVYVHHHGSETFKALMDAGQITDYDAICDRNDNHVSEIWGNDDWKTQEII